MRDYSTISSLFSSFNNSSSSNNLFNSINLSDYNLIKTGSYGKLMKSYYNTDSDSKKSETVSNVVNKLSDATDKTGLTKIKSEANELKESATKLKSSDLWADDSKREDITSAVKDFAKNYNDVIEQSGKVDSTDVSNNMKWMTSMTSTMSKALSKVGITVGTDNKLTVDEDKLASANVKDIKNLFNGDSTYGGQIEQKANNIANAANTAALYNSQATAYNSFQSMFNVGI